MTVVGRTPESWLARPGLNVGDVVIPHRDMPVENAPRWLVERMGRREREGLLDITLSPGATRCFHAGLRSKAERPDPVRTPHERDLHRIVHSTAFRRLAGKTQVVTGAPDHVRTRLTHSIGVAQIARSICEALGFDATLAEAASLSHDCGHCAGGHSGEEAMQAFIFDFDHAVFGADVILKPLNLCEHTLDAVRNHSWSRPSPSTPEGMVVSLADRAEYTVADAADAMRMGLVSKRDVPTYVKKVLGETPREQLGAIISGVVDAVASTGLVGFPKDVAEAVDQLRTFNYERIYSSELSMRQRECVVPMLRSLVVRYSNDPRLFGREDLDDGSDEALRAAVTYVVGMTDRFAATAAATLCGWGRDRLPVAV